ncbi:hypothetical protein GNAINCEL_00047 [Serratia phage KKP 3709]|nr:hypothetical protein GNAINCEL_00047 [Serratia phage KKP 3709]
MKEESELLKKHMKALKEAKGVKIDAGWFASDRYPNGRSIAANARIQNDGGTWQGKLGYNRDSGQAIHDACLQKFRSR